MKRKVIKGKLVSRTSDEIHAWLQACKVLTAVAEKHSAGGNSKDFDDKIAQGLGYMLGFFTSNYDNYEESESMLADILNYELQQRKSVQAKMAEAAAARH